MSTCPRSDSCGFFQAVQPSLVKRLKYATSYPYCNTGRHNNCAIYTYIADGRTPPSDLLPDGGIGEYGEAGDAGDLDEVDDPGTGMKVVVLDDSAVFAMFAANAVASALPGATVVRCETYTDALAELSDGSCGLVVCGYGVGEGVTAHDLRRASSAPMVLLTGRPESEIDMPSNARVVLKGAGPDALRAAIGAAAGC